MLDGSYFIECACGSDEHTLRFVLDKQEKELYVTVFLAEQPLYLRIWNAIKYIFGYKSKYGHFYCWTMNPEDVDKFKKMIEDFEK